MAAKKNVLSRNKTTLIILSVLILFCWLLQFDFVAKIVSDVTGISKESLQDVGLIAATALTGIVIMMAFTAIVIPFVSPVMIIVGAIALIYSLITVWNWHAKTNDKGTISGLGQIDVNR